MRCKCCDKLLTEWEARTRNPKNKSEFLDLCSSCKQWSNPFIAEKLYEEDNELEQLSTQWLDTDH